LFVANKKLKYVTFICKKITFLHVKLLCIFSSFVVMDFPIRYLVCLCLFSSLLGYSQSKNIQYSAKLQYVDEAKYPGAIVLIGNVAMQHAGADLTCQKALYYRDNQFFKAIGNVFIKQGDTITQTSNYADYDAKTKQALSWGNVVLTDPEMTLTTDTLHFDRVQQKLLYKNHATIKDATNTLESIRGVYSLEKKKFVATQKVSVVNTEHLVASDHLEYYTNSGHTYLYGPSTIINTSNASKIYCERGFYNTKTGVSHFVKNATLFLEDRTIEGDSLYYDKVRGFASATKNIRVIDTVRNFVTKGNYAELFEHKDSLFIVDRAVAISIIDKDSMFVHGDTILVTGKPTERIVRTFNNVRIFKSDLQGVCDSIHTNQQTGLTRLFKNPVLWSGKSQMTGDSIQLRSHPTTAALDSLKILGNAFIIQKDTVVQGEFNQIKGRTMLGKFRENALDILSVIGNAELLTFNSNKETGVLETITKQLCSSIDFNFVAQEIEEIKCFKKTEGNTYPPSEFPENTRKLRGFVWRENERPLTMEAIFDTNNSLTKPTTKKPQKLRKPIPKKPTTKILPKEFTKQL